MSWSDECRDYAGQGAGDGSSLKAVQCAFSKTLFVWASYNEVQIMTKRTNLQDG